MGESIVNQLFWMWAPISLLPDLLRIFVVLFVVLQLTRLILMNLVPPAISLLCRLLKKMLYLITYPVMALISTMQRSLREAGKMSIPIWVDFIEEMFALFERFFNKIIELSTKRKRNRARIKKWTFYSATALTVLLTAAIINNPNEWFSVKWKKTETWLTQVKLEKQLGFHVPDLPVSVQTKASPPNPKEFVLNNHYKDGGNIREAPTLTARRLYTIAVGEAVHFLNEEQVDTRGLKWLKVETANGRITGWISARIVREK